MNIEKATFTLRRKRIYSHNFICEHHFLYTLIHSLSYTQQCLLSSVCPNATAAAAAAAVETSVHLRHSIELQIQLTTLEKAANKRERQRHER